MERGVRFESCLDSVTMQEMHSNYLQRPLLRNKRACLYIPSLLFVLSSALAGVDQGWAFSA